MYLSNESSSVAKWQQSIILYQIQREAEKDRLVYTDRFSILHVCKN